MQLHFFKYQAAGNDFIIIDNRTTRRGFSADEIGRLCDRRFGIGADGLMLIEDQPEGDFTLHYYNADGTRSLCGNGCRAAVQFASSIGLIRDRAVFSAFDGIHEAEIIEPGLVRLKMNDVKEIIRKGEDFFLDTGSPHFVRFVDDVEKAPVVEEGRRIRYDAEFAPGGTNVNFVQKMSDDTLFVRTYERGVEDETLSCGTGIVASALAASRLGMSSPVNIQAPGGRLSVEYEISTANPAGHEGRFTNIFLTGPAKLVLEGDLEL